MIVPVDAISGACRRSCSCKSSWVSCERIMIPRHGNLEPCHHITDRCTGCYRLAVNLRSLPVFPLIADASGVIVAVLMAFSFTTIACAVREMNQSGKG
jgi:hypothetical protein